MMTPRVYRVELEYLGDRLTYFGDVMIVCLGCFDAQDPSIRVWVMFGGCLWDDANFGIQNVENLDWYFT